MITDAQTNTLFLADSLPKLYPDFFKEFERVLGSCKIRVQLLPDTKDVWAVDYMPIQVETNKFIRFVYHPRYLRTKSGLKTISDVDAICNQIGIETIKSDIVLDGGNVIRATDKVIMTERVFKENPSFTKLELIRKLQTILQIDTLIFIPEQPYDFTGHADGLVRFLDDETLIINTFGEGESKRFVESFKSAISKTGLDYVCIPYNPYSNKGDSAKGCYINYLQMHNTVIVPIFGIKEDDEVFKQFEKLFQGQTVATINGNEIAKKGGILNCITWNVVLE